MLRCASLKTLTASQAIVDASGSVHQLADEATIAQMRAAGVIVSTTNTLCSELAFDWSTPTGQKVIGTMFEAKLLE